MKAKLMEMTLKEVREMGKIEVAVLPWGACEAHNMHLPYGTDTISVEAVSELSVQKAREKGAAVIALPAMPIGVNTNSLVFPMTMNWMPSTKMAIIKDIVHCLEVHKVHKLVILNGHGGNEFHGILRELHGSTPVRVFLLNWWTARDVRMDDILDDKGGEHANESETSTIMYLRPELVHLEWADDGAVRTSRLKAMRDGLVWMPRPWHHLTKNSGHGNPVRATAEKGRMQIEPAVEQIADFFVELANTPLDKTFPY